MTSSATKFNRNDLLWWVGCLVISAVYCCLTNLRIGAAFDEPLEIRAALNYWHTGSMYEMLRMGCMPLPGLMGTLPVYLWEQWRGYPFDTWSDFHELLPIARSVSFIFWGALIFYVGKISLMLGGHWAARLSMLLVAVEPNLLGHAALLPKDIGLTATLFAFIYHWKMGRDRTWSLRILLPAVLYAVSLLTKASTLAFAPLCMLAIEIESSLRMNRMNDRPWYHLGWLRPFVIESMQCIALGMTFVFLFCGSDWRPEPSFVTWAQNLPTGSSRDIMVWLSENLCIFSNAGNALLYQIKHNFRGHSSFILGESYPRAVWFYFPVALAMKSVLPILISTLTVIVLRPRWQFHWLGACALALFLFSFKCNVQIGIRLIFPLLVMSLVMLSIALVRFADASAWAKRFVVLVVLGLAGYSVSESVRVFPNALTYINSLGGGNDRGYHNLSDSNYDWGQGIPELSQWREQYSVDNLSHWYFGTDPRTLLIGSESVNPLDWPMENINDFREKVRGRYFAVCTTILYGSYVSKPEGLMVIRYLRTLPIYDRTTTFIIYDFTQSDAGIPVAGQ